jgi:hypothetical protein
MAASYKLQASGYMDQAASMGRETASFKLQAASKVGAKKFLRYNL